MTARSTTCAGTTPSAPSPGDPPDLDERLTRSRTPRRAARDRTRTLTASHASQHPVVATGGNSCDVDAVAGAVVLPKTVGGRPAGPHRRRDGGAVRGRRRPCQRDQVPARAGRPARGPAGAPVGVPVQDCSGAQSPTAPGRVASWPAAGRLEAGAVTARTLWHVIGADPSWVPCRCGGRRPAVPSRSTMLR